ncbi:FKBP-type peptidyl-prolyl cis-trans isomerase [Tenacibaculum jejuense]|uniref:Peptidyl-prolyl cis-trans isomerase n=1 Tax=Tenacibaculum jejuense TaxID=584609 RepID=A0A238U962_9FLAO|nr:FKBP-type peptidyl-prolyl cis-trans isomerase [Tenacibaculum jejuense]SNR15733.1 FKBP-type peptidyl-prolyl cis-trans isomerase [Tenacibaculum jejuense]
MMKIKHILLIGIISILVYSCGDNDPVSTIDPNFDHAAQSTIDNDSLVKFFQNHYYDLDTDLVKPMEDGKTPLSQDPNLITQDVVETINGNDIDFKLYAYVRDEGTSSKGNPTVVDSVLVNYSGRKILDSERISPVQFDINTNLWFVLGSSVIRGWTFGMTNFKGGVNATMPNGPITYSGTGKGVLFIPSGLAYRNEGQPSGGILPNDILMFYVEMNDIVADTDIDNDGIPSILEDLDGDGRPWNDDTDGNGVPNFLDPDDDGDLVLTRNEDTMIEDGNPLNDFSDTDNPSLPDYLNPDIRKSKDN